MFGIGFLNHIFLFAAAAALLPVIIHLLNRKRVRKIPFSTLRFIEDTFRKKMRRINLRRLLVLLLRTLAILFLVLVFARPTIKSWKGFALPGGAPASVIICLDESYSMGVEREKGTAFSEAKEIAGKIIDRCGKRDRINVVGFSTSSEAAFDGGTRSKTAAKKAVAGLELTQKATGFREAITAAVELVEESGEAEGEIYIISDFRKACDSLMIPEDLGQSRLFLVPVYKDAIENVSIDKIYIPRKLIRPGEVFKIGVALTNHSTEERADFPVEITIDGKCKAEQQVSLSPASSAALSFPLSLRQHGLHRCSVRKSRDRLHIDDERYFLLRLFPSVPVLLVKGAASGGPLKGPPDYFYLSKALNPWKQGEGEFTVTPKQESSLTMSDLPRDGVVFWVNPGRSAKRRLGAIRNYVEGGGALAVFLGNEDALEDRRFSAFVGVKGYKKITAAAPRNIGLFKDAHPVFNIFSDDELEILSRSGVKSYIAASGVHPDSILAYIEGGKPFLWECTRGKGRVLVFASSPDMNGGSLVLSPMFLPLIHTAASYLADAALGGLQREILLGGSVRFDLAKMPENAIEDLSVEVGGEYVGSPASRGGAEESALFFDGTQTRGFYTLLQDTTVLAESVVNIDTRESNLNPLDLDTLDAPHRVVGGERKFTDSLKAAREGREIYALFLVLAIAALVGEAILARKA